MEHEFRVTLRTFKSMLTNAVYGEYMNQRIYDKPINCIKLCVGENQTFNEQSHK